MVRRRGRMRYVAASSTLRREEQGAVWDVFLLVGRFSPCRSCCCLSHVIGNVRVCCCHDVVCGACVVCLSVRAVQLCLGLLRYERLMPVLTLRVIRMLRVPHIVAALSWLAHCAVGSRILLHDSRRCPLEVCAEATACLPAGRRHVAAICAPVLPCSRCSLVKRRGQAGLLPVSTDDVGSGVGELPPCGS